MLTRGGADRLRFADCVAVGPQDRDVSIDAGVVENVLSPAYRGADVTLLFAAKAALVAVP